MKEPDGIPPQRYLAMAGMGSRRACDEMVKAGKVVINGKKAEFGMKVKPGDVVRVDGIVVNVRSAMTYVMVNKPQGFVSDHAESPSALDLPDMPAGLHAVGRLDKDATGFLLLTDDGELSQRLTHPRYEHEKQYEVWVEGIPDGAALAKWRAGVVLRGVDGEEELTAPAKVDVIKTKGSACMLRVVLKEGKKRQIKRVAKAVGHPVQAIQRVRIGPLWLDPELAAGKWRRLTREELAVLRDYTEPSAKPKPRRKA